MDADDGEAGGGDIDAFRAQLMRQFSGASVEREISSVREGDAHAQPEASVGATRSAVVVVAATSSSLRSVAVLLGGSDARNELN